MDEVQTLEEKGKMIYAQQAREQILQAQQEEEIFREESETKRRLKERQAIVYLTYLRIFEEEDKVRREIAALDDQRKKEFYRQRLQQANMFNKLLLSSLAHHDTAVSDFLFDGESDDEREKREALLEQAEMKTSEFSALAMADLCQKPENKEDVEKVFIGKMPSSKLIEQRKESLNHAEEAVADFSKGKIEKMEAILKGGLINACHAFSHTKDTLCAIHWSKQINGILSIINSHPVLFQDGINTPLLEAATGMAAIGRVMENGLEALNELYSAQLNGVPLSPEKEMNLQAQILLMQQTDAQRSNEQYQKFFAKGYHPINGLEQEKLKNLLKQLNSSQAMYTLSSMNKEEKLFALSDADSRRMLGAELFLPHAEKQAAAPEKKPAVPEKQAEKAGPGLR